MPSCGIRSYHCHLPNSRKNRSDNKMALRLLFFRLAIVFVTTSFFNIRTKVVRKNVIRRMMLLKSLNIFFLRVTAANVTEDERPFYAWFCAYKKTTASAVCFSANLYYIQY